MKEGEEYRIEKKQWTIGTATDASNSTVKKGSVEAFLVSRTDAEDITLLYEWTLVKNVADANPQNAILKDGDDYKHVYIVYNSRYEANVINEYDSPSALPLDYPVSHFSLKASKVLTLFSNPEIWETGIEYNLGVTTSNSMCRFYRFRLSNNEIENIAFSVDGDKTVVSNVDINSINDIKNINHGLKYYPAVYNTAEFVLQNDISDVGGSTSLVLGTDDVPFEGTFNGNNHKITGLVVSNYLDGIKELTDPNDANKTIIVAANTGLFGSIGTNGSVSALELHNVSLNFDFNDNVFSNYRNEPISVGILAGDCAGSISNIFISSLVFVSDISYYNDGWISYTPKINLSLVANLDNGEEDESKQASINNVAVYLPNGGLQYKSYEDLETLWSNNGGYYLGVSFYNAYFYWCNFAQYFLAFKEESTCPTFESFVAWYKQLTGETLAIFTETIENCNFEDDSELLPLVTDFEAWYSAEAQAALRTADAAAWEAYANSQAGGDGNEVAVVATQNLCKSPGKGRTHKVCSAPSGKSNKSILLNPYDENAPLTEMQCTAEEFASGYAAHWLNYDDPGFTGNYNKMWSQGLLHPILATEKNKYVVKLEYYNEDNNDSHGFAYTKQFVKVGSQASVSYTDKPKSIVVGGSPLGEIGESSTSFKVPGTPVNKGIVKVQFSFDSTLTGVSDEDAQPTVRIIAHGRVVTVSGAEGKQIAISDLRGLNIINQTATSPRTDIVVPERGIYVVKAGKEVRKVVIE
ncbi:MAG: hypothetical protein J6Y82_11190 [Bacteroidales bacterium]|nr:hypothetical protein [Bacteroidales bacterium]